MLISLSQQYTPVSSDDKEPTTISRAEQSPRAGRWLSGIVIFIIGIVALIWYNLKGAGTGPVFVSYPSPCLEPKLRREWRQLSRTEKSSYIQAVKCVHESPSKLHSDGQLTDDFPWSHRLIEHYGWCRT